MTLVVSRCKAVSFCREECEQKHWGVHEAVCHAIKSTLNSTVDHINQLTDKSIFSEIFPTFMEEGRHKSISKDGAMLRYILARAKLTMALLSCDSKLAKELAVEHILDIMYLYIRWGAVGELGCLLLLDLGRWSEAGELINVMEQREYATMDSLSVERKSFIEFIKLIVRLKLLR